jgi:hypothetical protein
VLTSLDLDLGSFRAKTALKARLALDMQDAYASDEPVRIRVQPDQSNLKISLRLASVDSRGNRESASLTGQAGEWLTHEFSPRKEGIYRVMASAGRNSETASDLVVVYDAKASENVPGKEVTQ